MKSTTYIKHILIGNFFLICLFSSKVVNSQNVYPFRPPKGEINLFTAYKENDAAKKYNSLTTRQQRDSLIRKKLDEDWTHTVPPSTIPPIIWACGHFTSQLETNSHDWGDGVYSGEKLLYNGYRGYILDSIYQNGGTLLDMGKLGLPLWQVVITDPITLPSGHALVAVLTGNDITKWEDWNIIEAGYNTMNVKPGGTNTNLPRDCQKVMFFYSYLTVNKHGQKCLNGVCILAFSLKEGVPTLTYNVNDGTTPPNYNGNPHFNEIFHVIEKRDVTPPVLTINSPSDNSTYSSQMPILNYTITDENFKSAWYSLDGGKTKNLLEKNGTRSLDLPNGNYNMTIQAEDYFLLTASKSISFTVNIPRIPTVTTAFISDITNMTATSGGNVTSSGGADVIVKGVCWSTKANPTITDNVTTDGAGIGSFTSSITKLLNGTTYHVRAYATNSVGTGYGEDIKFMSLVTEISENTNPQILIYPNPTNGYLSVEIDQSFTVGSKFEVCDYCGRIEFQKNLEGGDKYDFDLTHLGKGMYFIRIQNKNKYYFQKIVIQ
jgi:hypothetical protein